MDNILKDHEAQFLQDTTETGRFILSIGSKGSGKSYLLCSYLKYVLKHNIFKNIHFVCPCFSGEANNSYGFLKNQKHVLVYPHYSETITKIVDKDRRKGRTLFMVDDASGELLKQVDSSFIQLATTTRHFAGCTVYVCVHSCKKILSPIIRQNLDHLFIYRIINVKLLEDLYDEYFSMLFDNFKQFKQFYTSSTAEANSCLHFSLHQDGIDTNVKHWDINENQISDLKPTHGPTKTKPQEIKNPLRIEFNRRSFGKLKYIATL